MSVTDDLDCKIFIDLDVNVSELTQLVSNILGAEVSQSLPKNKVITPYCEIYIIENEYFNEISRIDFPSGFIAFRYFLEVYANIEKPKEKKLNEIVSLLRYFWTHNIPAVAACDYEDELPEQGGSGSQAIPWPTLD